MKAFLRILKEFDVANIVSIKHINSIHKYLNSLLTDLMQGEINIANYGVCSITIEDDKKTIERLINLKMTDYNGNELYRIYYNAYKNNSIEFILDLWISLSSLLQCYWDGLRFKDQKVNNEKAISIADKIYTILKYYYSYNN